MKERFLKHNDCQHWESLIFNHWKLLTAKGTGNRKWAHCQGCPVLSCSWRSDYGFEVFFPLIPSSPGSSLIIVILLINGASQLLCGHVFSHQHLDCVGSQFDIWRLSLPHNLHSFPGNVRCHRLCIRKYLDSKAILSLTCWMPANLW